MKEELTAAGIDLPIYWGNRNWHPMLPDTLQQMKDDGKKRALAFFTSMFSCYSGCRQCHRENIAAAQEQVGPGAPIVQKVRMGFNHPGFIDAMAKSVGDSLQTLDQPANQVKTLFTAHSIPLSMADNCDYVKQVTEACRFGSRSERHHRLATCLSKSQWASTTTLVRTRCVRCHQRTRHLR